MDDATDVVAATEGFTNISKNDAVSVWDGCVDEENDNWDLFFIKVSMVCNIFGKICLTWE